MTISQGNNAIMIVKSAHALMKRRFYTNMYAHRVFNVNKSALRDFECLRL